MKRLTGVEKEIAIVLGVAYGGILLAFLIGFALTSMF